MLRATNRKNLLILAFTLFVVMLGFGVIIPILPFYVEQMGAGGTELGLLVASYAVMRLICGPLWGSLSDRVGRKPVLLIGILGYAITMFWFGLATELWMLFVARILSGILSSATAPTTMAYIADSTTEKERSGGMGILGAAGGLGTIFGPVAGGLLAGKALSLPFFIAAGMALLALVLAALFLPESLPAEARRKMAARPDITGLAAWQHEILSPLGILFLLTFLSTCGLMIFANVFGLYALRRYGFGPEMVGLIMMVLGLASAFAQGVLAGPLTRRWGEVLVIRGAFLASAFGFGLMLLAGDLVSILASHRVLRHRCCAASAAADLAHLATSDPVPGHHDGVEQRFHQSGAHCRAAGGRRDLRREHHTALSGWSRRHVGGCRDQPDPGREQHSALGITVETPRSEG